MNVSEGARPDVVADLAASAGPSLLDVHRDEHHNRSVLTLAGPAVEDAARSLTARAIETLDLRTHAGVHPRIGVVDVVPFVPLGPATIADAVAARARFASWAAVELGVPCFLYGPERSLPDVRRGAFTTIRPDTGPPSPHPTAGAIAVGARPVLVAYNLWLAAPADTSLARRIAGEIRGPSVRALGLDVGGQPQVSCNLVAPATTGPGAVYDAVAGRARIERAELVGLLPAAVLQAEPPDRWSQLDLGADRTIEARLQEAGLGGS